jgi:hypothetical protein
MHTVLWNRIRELGLDTNEVAACADIDRIMVDELAMDDQEVDAWPLGDLKRLVDVLGVDLLELLGVSCAYCERIDAGCRTLQALPRNELIRRRREQLGLSKQDVLDQAGWTEWFARVSDQDYGHAYMREYAGIEDEPDSIDELMLYDVQRLNDRVLKLPLHLLLGVKCPKCGR